MLRVSTLPERVLWILNNTVDPSTGKPWSARSLSLAAELGQSYVGQVLRGRLGKNQKSNTTDAIARASGVDPIWLKTGEGWPIPPEVPARARAASLCREAEVLEAAIDAVLAEQPTDAQLRWHTLRWAAYIQERALKMTLEAFQTEPRAPSLPAKQEAAPPALPAPVRPRTRR
jgi:hypothetical protein